MLSSRLIIISGITAAGKTTLAEGLARHISNAVYLSRDQVAYGGLLLVNDSAETPNLPPFKEYVARDKIFPNDAERIETPFGPMTLIHDSARSDFYKRHAREQGYLIMGRLATANLAMAKIPIIEGFLARSIESGTLKAFLDQPAFAPYPKYVIHVIADVATCLERQKNRAQRNPEASIRSKYLRLHDETFKEIMARDNPPVPNGLNTIPHLLLDTSSLSPEKALSKSLKYISS